MGEFHPRRVLLLMDNRSDSNWGSQATTSELVKLIEQTFPQAELRSLRRHDAGRRKWARSLGHRFAPLGPLSGWKDPRGETAVRSLMLGWPRGLESWPDLIIVNGEGTLHPQVQTRMWLPLIDSIRRASGAKLWVVNCSIMLEGEDQGQLFDAVLSRADRIVLREPKSFRLVQSLGWPAEQGADCAFLSHPAPDLPQLLGRHRIEGPYIVATGAATSRDWDTEAAHKWIKALRHRCATMVWTASTPTDISLHQRICPELPILTNEHLSYPELLALIGGAQLHFGGRYHPTIFSAMTGTPFVAITSNTHKMEGLMEWIGKGGPLLHHRNGEEVLSAIEAAPLGQRMEAVQLTCRELRAFSKRNILAG